MKLYRHCLEDIPKIVTRDVERIQHDAAVVLEIIPDGVREHHNLKPSLKVLAVVGPGHSGSMVFPKAVLLEVGLGRTIPYHASRNGRWSAERYPLCGLDRERYTQLSPLIFRILQRITDERVATWENGPDNPFFIRARRSYVTRRGGLYVHEGKGGNGVAQVFPRGLRFSVARRDRMLLADVYWLQLYGSDRQEGFARFADKLLGAYRGDHGFANRPYVRWLENELRARCPERDKRGSWPPYLLVQMLEHLPGGRRNRRFHFLADLIGRVTGWRGGPTQEQQLAGSACPDPESRLNGIHLRDISSLRLGDARKDHVVFEILPSIGLKGKKKERRAV